MTREMEMDGIDAVAGKFRSGNAVPIDRAVITADEWASIVAERDKLRAERDAAIIERNQTLARWESALTKNVYNLSSLDGQLDSMRIERDRLAELCRHVHDRILRGDSDKELLDLLEEAWR